MADNQDTRMVPSASVLLITFNRPDYTEQVIGSLKIANIKKLYVFNDGPREGNCRDSTEGEKIRELVKGITWVDVETFFSDTNLGCGLGVSSAISWAFRHEDRLIILEDDCLASESFFPFCNYLLEKYKDDTRVWMVCGENHLYPSWAFKGKDYIFSRFGFNWGWATWKRCWDQFDIKMNALNDFIMADGLENTFWSNKIVRAYKHKYGRINTNREKPSYWTAQFGFAIVSNNGLFVIPKRNMIQNIGIEGDHTLVEHKYHNASTFSEFKIQYEPKFVLADKKVDQYHYCKRIQPLIYGRSVRQKIIKKVNQIVMKVIAFGKSQDGRSN